MTIMTKDDKTKLSDRQGNLPTPAKNALPLTALFALAMAAFITILTETLPAGLLPQMAQSLSVSEALVGQLVTIYAIGSLVAAIPLTAVTQGIRRRPLLLVAIAGFVITNTITTFSTNYAMTIAARLLAGVSAGLVWALLAGYAARMVPEHQKGRAIAIAMVGTPLALSLGVPMGAFISTLVGWRICFGIISLLAVVLMVWVRFKVPDFPGQPVDKRSSLRQVLITPGIRSILFVVLTFVLAHNILYTYIAPFLARAEMAERTDLVLLAFGITSLIAIWIVGILIDRYLRVLTFISTLLFIIAALALYIAGENPITIYVSVSIWGLAFGGAATLFQTALFKAAGNEAADVAQSMSVTVWNMAIAGGGIVGGLLLGHFGVGAFPPTLLILLMITFVIILSGKQHSFPATTQ